MKITGLPDVLDLTPNTPLMMMDQIF
ncbi:uncharacterized protein METZ01_LOCUS110257, partial [marine metagenome]